VSFSIAVAFLAVCPACPQEESVRVPGTDVSLDLVRIPGGRHKTAGTGREVDLLPFWIGRHEVTWEEFNPFYEWPEKEKADGITRPSRGRDFLGLSGIPSHFMESRRPVTNVRFHSALAFCRWLSVSTGQYFRLPTEAEWEHACGPGPGSLEESAWTAANSGESTHEGGKKKPNAFGLHDMAGNVWEYALEPFDPPAFGPALRGGAWNSPPSEAGATFRKPVPPAWSEADPSRPLSVWWFRGDFSQGFRVVRVPESAGPEERKAYARSIEFSGLAGKERTVKVGGSAVSFSRVTGEVRNGGDRALEELEILVYFLTPGGKPHVKDVSDYWAGYATFNICYPVLANSAHPGDHARPLKPGEARKFAVDVPTTLDGEDEVSVERFGAAATNLHFSPK
jgi:formylglycine-generating enzyme required for sulfatase activity